MDSGSESSVLESVEDNGEVKDELNFGVSRVQSNGSYVVENTNLAEFFSEMMGNGTDGLGSVSSFSEERTPEFSPSPSVTKKGNGLRKWKRIPRGVNIVGETGADSGNLAMHDDLVSGVSSVKRAQLYAERNQKGEDSASSTNGVVRNLDGFPLLGDLEVGPSFAADTDSDDSEDGSSKSSTAASAPKIKHVRMGAVSSYNKSRTSSIDMLTHSLQHNRLEKGRSETSKKARMGRVKIEKENSHSSVESDLRSSMFIFMQGICSTSNGIQSERWLDSDGEHGEEAQCSEREVSDGVQGGYNKERVGEYGSMSTSVGAESSPYVKVERSNSHSSSTDQDPGVDSVSKLQSVHDALEKELLKFKEIKDVMPPPSSEDASSFSEAVQPEVFDKVNGNSETELEVIFKQKIEAEVKLLAVSSSVEHLRSVATDQLPVSDRPEVLGPDKNQLDNLKASEKLKTDNDAIAIADETLKLQKKVCKYTACSFVQLVLLIVTLAIFSSELSPDYVVVVPT